LCEQAQKYVKSSAGGLNNFVCNNVIKISAVVAGEVADVIKSIGVMNSNFLLREKFLLTLLPKFFQYNFLHACELFPFCIGNAKVNKRS